MRCDPADPCQSFSFFFCFVLQKRSSDPSPSQWNAVKRSGFNELPSATAQPLHQQMPMDEMRRISQSQPMQHRSYDEYESDDELRREEISFSIDGGSYNFIIHAFLVLSVFANSFSLPLPRLSLQKNSLGAANVVVYKAVAAHHRWWTND